VEEEDLVQMEMVTQEVRVVDLKLVVPLVRVIQEDILL
jgi:hypothetical protein